MKWLHKSGMVQAHTKQLELSAGRSYLKTHIKIDVESGFFFYGALLLLMLPFWWTMGVCLAVAVHELGHIIALSALGIPIRRICVTANGVRIHSDGMPLWKELIVSLAGPMGGVLVVFLLPVFPEAAVCACVHTVFNLIPVYPFDGGRTVFAACKLLFGKLVGQKIMIVIQIVTCMVVLFVSVVAIGYVGLIALLPVFLVLKSANIVPRKTVRT